MGEPAPREPEFVVAFPVYFVVRVPDTNDAADIVRNVLRLGAKGIDATRRWFVPVFTSEAAARRLIDDTRTFENKLQVFYIDNLNDWVTLLDALFKNGDKLAAFDQHSTYVEHIEINGLLAECRKQLPDGRDPNPAGPACDPGRGRSWLRSRLTAFRSHPPESGDGGSRPEAAGRHGTGRAPDGVQTRNSQLTPGPPRPPSRQ
jgi:hypothetical protein